VVQRKSEGIENRCAVATVIESSHNHNGGFPVSDIMTGTEKERWQERFQDKLRDYLVSILSSRHYVLLARFAPFKPSSNSSRLIITRISNLSSCLHNLDNLGVHSRPLLSPINKPRNQHVNQGRQKYRSSIIHVDSCHRQSVRERQKDSHIACIEQRKRIDIFAIPRHIPLSELEMLYTAVALPSGKQHAEDGDGVGCE
jgi:hypothetical protein